MSFIRKVLRLTVGVIWTIPLAIVGCIGWLVVLGRQAAFARFASSVVQIWSKGLLWIFNVKVQTFGDRPGKGHFAVSNHLGHLDVLVLASLYRTNFIAKVEISGWPVIGHLARLGATLWVNREKARDAVRLGKELEHLLQRGVTITMFPEGHACRGDEIHPFKPPLFETPATLQVPCVPIAITYRTPGPGGEDDGHPGRTVCWWQGDSFAGHYWNLLGFKRILARVRFAEPVHGIADRKALAAETQKKVEEMFEPVPQ